MFAKAVVRSDNFLDMPQTTQNLYFHFGVEADDDGFVSNPRRLMRMLGNGDDDLRVLIAKGFVINFDSGVIVVKHWKVNNYIQSDRYKSTQNTAEKALLRMDKGNVYTLDTDCIHHVSMLDAQTRLDKTSLVKTTTTEDEELLSLFFTYKMKDAKKPNYIAWLKREWQKGNQSLFAEFEAIKDSLIKELEAKKEAEAIASFDYSSHLGNIEIDGKKPKSWTEHDTYFDVVLEGEYAPVTVKKSLILKEVKKWVS